MLFQARNKSKNKMSLPPSPTSSASSTAEQTHFMSPSISITTTQIYSLAFAEPNDVSEYGDQVLIPNELYTKLFLQDNNTATELVFLLKIMSPWSGNMIIANVALPHTLPNAAIFVPQWMMTSLETEEGMDVEIEVEREQPPHATSIILKPIDETILRGDARQEIEDHFRTLHILQEGTTIEVPLVGQGTTTQIYIHETKPASIVLLRNEVELEILEPFVRTPTPIPAPPTLLKLPSPTANSITIATQTQTPTQNHIITPTPKRQTQTKELFVPFSGVGKRLCD